MKKPSNTSLSNVNCRPRAPLSSTRKLSPTTGKLKPSELDAVRSLHKRGIPALTLAEFVSAAWDNLPGEQNTPLVWNWHLDAICAHVEAVLRGPGPALALCPLTGKPWQWSQNLLINVPPGTMKSLIVSVFAPAWMWLHRPSWRSLFASSSAIVSLRDSVRCRELIESQWYRETFAVTWRLAEDQNAKGNYRNTAGGFRVAVNVGTKITGNRVDALFVDDPLDAADAPSETARAAVTYWWDSALANRVNSPELSTRIVIMQRLHEEDLSGHLMEQGYWAQLCLPMEYEREGKGAGETFLGWKDPRKAEGELLMPARFPESVLEQERRRLGTRGYAGQMQQRPAPASGNQFKREWWKFWKAPGAEDRARPRGCSAAPAVPIRMGDIEEMVQSWDCTFKDTDGTDFVVGLVVGRIGANKYVLACKRERMGFSATQRAIVAMSADWPLTFEKLIEDKANGSAIIETLSQDISGIVAVEPKGSKEARAAACEPQVEAGNVYLPEGAEWLDEFIEEFASFPMGKHDDQVDALSQALLKFYEDSDVNSARALLGFS